MKRHDMTYALGGRTAVRVALAALVLAASAACNSGDDADRGSAAANTVVTEPAPTTTTNPYAVPAVIDEAYVNRVLAGLDATLGDVTRLVMRTKTIPPEAYQRLRAIYGTDDLLQLIIDSIQSDLRRGMSGYRSDPGNRVSSATQIVSGTSRCVFAQIQRDYVAVSTNPITINPQWVALKPEDSSRDPGGHNPTSWAFVYDGFPQDRSAPTNPCAA